MKIEKFTHVKNGKTIYVVMEEPDRNNALMSVCRYKKDAKSKFLNTHNIYTGLVKNNKLYMADINIKENYGKGIKPCYVVARKNINLDLANN